MVYLDINNKNLRTMKLKNIQKYFYIGMAIFIMSCSQDKSDIELGSEELKETNLKSFVDYLQIYSQPTEFGSILIQSNGIASRPDDPSSVVISEKISPEKGKTIQLIDAKRNEINPSQNGKSTVSSKSEYVNIFGNDLSYRAVGRTNKSSTQSMYVPQLINLELSSEVGRAGSVVSWNVDQSNNEGVVLYATYHPLHQADLMLAEQNQDRIVRGIVLPDNQGSYTITTEDLERFPNNSYVEITVARAATTTVDKSTIKAVTKSSTSIQVQR